MKIKLLSLVLLCLLGLFSGCKSSRKVTDTASGPHLKREFRGAWIQTAFQDEYRNMTPAQLRQDFVRKLDYLQQCGINAIIFQVRPEADAFYPSKLEPWSRFYTGQQGRAPEGNFDLMALDRKSVV